MLRRGLLVIALLFASAPTGAGASSIAVQPEGEALPQLAHAGEPQGVAPVKYQLQIAPDDALRSFSAQALIVFDLAGSTRQIVLDSAKLRISSARLDDKLDLHVHEDAPGQRLILTAARPLDPGRHSIRVHYRGEIHDQGPGLFRVLDEPPSRAAYLYTALCCGKQARYLAPLWDRPGAKAVFELVLLLEESFEAVSTMPVRRREPAAGGQVRIEFQPTPRMTPRLFFFAAGPFERIARRHDGVETGVVVPRRLAVSSALVLDTTLGALRQLGDYLGVHYPLPKLDGVLLPHAPGGAIANWGAIQYAQRYLTAGVPSATRAELQIIYAMIAHEVSHQWFANLLTPRERGHAWLSEGFAVWFENRIAEELHPDWPSWLHAVQYREAAMQLDALATTHPVVIESLAAEQSTRGDSEIIYDKSAQVLRMLEAHVGEQAFRRAMRQYVERHAYASVDSDDFWQVLASVSSAASARIGRDFTEQVGVPLVEVLSTRCVDGHARIVLHQRAFGAAAQPATEPRTWHVPVSVVTVAQRRRSHRVVSGMRPQELEVAGCSAVKVNAQNIGYFRTRYDARSFAALAEVFAQLGRDDQLGLLHDQYALAEAGEAPFGDYLDLASGLSARFDPFVNLQWVLAARALDQLYRGNSGRAAFREFASARLGALLDDVGWEPEPGEPGHMPVLRAALIEVLGRLGEAGVHEEAARRYAAAGRHAGALPRALREAIMKTIGAAADQGTADDLLQRAALSADLQERRLYWLALASVSDPQVARKVLDWTIADPEIGEDLRSSVLSTMAAEHTDHVYERVESAEELGATRAPSLLEVAKQSADRRIARRLAAFLAQHPGADARAFERARAEILHRDAVRRMRLPDVARWLADSAKGRQPGLRKSNVGQSGR